MATNVFKVARGSYLSMKKTSGKDDNTLYFGYDGPNLGGIFVGDREITSTLKDAIIRVNPQDNKYLDLVFQNVDANGKMYKTAFKLLNTPVLEQTISDIQDDILSLRADVNDVSARLDEFKQETAGKFQQVNAKFVKVDASINYCS